MDKNEISLAHLLETFIALMDGVETLETASRATEYDMDRLQQDYLHQLELECTTYHDRARIASKLRKCRIDRRIAKDQIAVCEPLTNFLSSENGKNMISQLRSIAQKIRNEENHIASRSYVPREMQPAEYYQFRNTSSCKKEKSMV